MGTSSAFGAVAKIFLSGERIEKVRRSLKLLGLETRANGRVFGNSFEYRIGDRLYNWLHRERDDIDARNRIIHDQAAYYAERTYHMDHDERLAFIKERVPEKMLYGATAEEICQHVDENLMELLPPSIRDNLDRLQEQSRVDQDTIEGSRRTWSIENVAKPEDILKAREKKAAQMTAAGIPVPDLEM